MEKVQQNLSRFIAERTFVIWGITELEHTHGYIHANFFRVMKRNYVNVLWLEDKATNLHKIPKGSIVLFVNIAANQLEFFKENYYIGHNSQEIIKFQTYIVQFPGHGINWSFTTRESNGVTDSSGSIAVFNEEKTTLFQPYGTPVDSKSFLEPISSRNQPGGIENLIGSVWNDERNRGNAEIIAEYASALKNRNLKIRRIELGKLARFNFSEKIEKKLVRDSAVGASIHSNYQISDGYLACRLFKSVSYGRAPVTNQNAFEVIFHENFIYSPDADHLIDGFLSLNFRDKKEMILLAQESLKQYTYEAGLNRLVRALRKEW
jgi:hypothetical protein